MHTRTQQANYQTVTDAMILTLMYIHTTVITLAHNNYHSVAHATIGGIMEISMSSCAEESHKFGEHSMSLWGKMAILWYANLVWHPSCSSICRATLHEFFSKQCSA